MAPSALLVLLGALIAASVTQMATRFAHSYIGLLLAALAGMVLGETMAGIAGGGPQLGALHPLADILAMAACEVIATTFFLPARRARLP